MEARRGLGWLPDIPKPTDYTEEHPAVAPLLAQTGLRMRVAAQSVFGAIETGAGGLSAPANPSRQDLRAYFSPIEDQGQLGSCTANAAVALLEYFGRRSCCSARRPSGSGPMTAGPPRPTRVTSSSRPRSATLSPLTTRPSNISGSIRQA